MSKWSSAYRDSRWQKLRLQIMERDGWKCKACGRGEKDGTTLNVHHAYYESNKSPWDYPAETLITYCEECHEERHAMQKRILAAMIKMSALGVSGIALITERFTCTAENFGQYEDTYSEDEEYDSDLDIELGEYVAYKVWHGSGPDGGVK